MEERFVLPLSGLCPIVKGIIEHFAAAKKSPTNYVATAMFAAVGAVAGKRVEVIDGGYSNYGQLYACLVGVPGACKSPAMDVVMQPLIDADMANYRAYKESLRAWKKAEDEEAQRPTLDKIACDDVTFERLATILSENPNGILLHCDELTDLTRNLNRYNNGDNSPKLTKLWSNQTVRVDRKGDEPLMIERPFLAILSSTQPANLSGIFSKHLGTGFFSRWLFCLPNEKPQQRAEPNPMFFEGWARIVKNIMDLPAMQLHFSPEAKEKLNEFDEMRDSLTAAMAESNTELAEHYQKQCYTIRRLAAIVHLLSYENYIYNGMVSDEITLSEFLYAEKLVEFYDYCAHEVLIQMGERRASAMTDKRLLQEFNDRFRPTNITVLASVIGKSRQYVSKCILRTKT